MATSASFRSAQLARKKSRTTSKRDAISAARLDALHDGGGDLSVHLDWASARRPGREVQRVNVDFPLALLRAIDREANRIGISRQAFIKLRLADDLTSRHHAEAVVTEKLHS